MPSTICYLKTCCFVMMLMSLLTACTFSLPETSNLPTPSVTIPFTPTQTATLTATPLPTRTPTSTLTPTPSAPPPEIARLRWEQIAASTNFQPVHINTIAVDPTNPDVIFVGTYGAGIYLSRDGGYTWQPANNGLGKGTVGSIVIDPSDARIVYAALFDQGGVYKSYDGGENWLAINKGIDLSGGWNWTGLLYIDPSNPKRLYYTGTTGGLFVTENAGGSWKRLSDSCLAITALAIDPHDPLHLYAATFEHPVDSDCRLVAGVYESNNGGQSWKLLTTPEMAAPPNEWAGDHWHLAVDPQDFNVIYAGGREQTFASLDGGRTWNKVLNRGCSMLTTHPNNGILYCGLWNSLGISQNKGATWAFRALEEGWVNAEQMPFAVSVGNNAIYAGGRTLIRSNDGGWNWKHLTSFGTGRMRIVVDPRSSRRLFLTTRDMSSNDYVSHDGGMNWLVMLRYMQDGRLSVDPIQNLIYRPGTFDNSGFHVYRSRDNGRTWEKFGSGYTTHAPWQILPDPRDPTHLWLIGECGTGLAFSNDNGQIFRQVESVPDVCQPILLIEHTGRRMYVVHWNGFLRSDDYGQTWRSFANLSGIYRAAALDPSNPDVVYVGSTYLGVLKTTDGGQTWRKINANLPARAINEIVVDPVNPQVIYIATDSGLFISLNGGEWWWSVERGLGPNPIVYSVAVDLNDSARVYVVTPDGVFRLTKE
jgi:photosystem II stability/assembly factor-like uncharacterized protein